MLETLHDVPWSDIDHAYGPADDVPATLRALLSDDADVRKKALWTLYGNIFHQGTRYEASAPAVPFLLHLVADPATPDRASLIDLLVALAIGLDESYLPGGFPLGELRAGAVGGAELLRDGGGGWARLQTLDEQDQDRLQARIELNVYEAVEAGVSIFVALLSDPDPDLRRQAAYALGWFPARASVTAAPLRARVLDDDATVAATAVISLGLLIAAEPGAVDDAREILLSLLNGDEPHTAAEPHDTAAPYATAGPQTSGDSRAVVRVAAAIALARGGDGSPAVVAELLRWTAGGPPTEVPFLEGYLAGYAALSLRLVLGDSDDDAFEALLSRLTSPVVRAEPATVLPVAAEALGRAFPDGPVPRETPFDDLTERQRRVVRALAAAPEAWPLGDFVWLVGGYGLPNEAGRMRVYAGTVKTP